MNFVTFKFDLPEDVRLTAITLLNQQLADALDLGLQAKQAHWNVKGPQFLSLHALFDQTAETVEEFADIMAERAVQLGGLAEGTVQTVVQASRLPRYDGNLLQGADHLHAISGALARFASTARTAILQATTAGDADTAYIMTQVSRETDALLWKVVAHIPEAWERPVAGRDKMIPKVARVRGIPRV
jgi:starvation-inducible DNA-binding protein